MSRLTVIKSALPAILVCLLTGCGSVPNSRPNPVITERENKLRIADEYVVLARQSDSETAKVYLLKSADLYIQTDNFNQAENILQKVNDRAGGEIDAFKQILLAQIALSHKDVTQAHRRLQTIWTPRQLPIELRIKFFEVKAETHLRSGSPLEAVQARIHLADYLETEGLKETNSRAIWEVLSQLTPNALRSLQRHQEKDTLSGWISFTHLTKQYDASPDQMARALAIWQRRYPNHPANVIIPNHEMAISNQVETVKPPKKVAILLPSQGPYAKSAEAIRDGFLAAYYHSHKSDAKPDLQIYDTTQYPDMIKLYQKVVEDGADFIVGPLIKEEVEAITELSKLDIPILALNTLPEATHAFQRQLFQFGLPPETEALAAAEKAWQDGHRNAIIIVPRSDWGNRMQTAFQQQWEAMGGRVIGIEKVTQKSDLNKDIQHLLAVDASQERAKKLRSYGLKFNYQPRRRNDPDFVFIATNAPLARQIKPLLNFHYAKNLPVYASSSVYDGSKTTGRDQDLNGILFCDMPWILDNTIAARQTYKSIQNLGGDQFDQYTRLYALGIDAYRVTLQINQLLLYPNFGISGMTGMLKLDPQQKIQRRLIWASFKNGTPVLINQQNSTNS